jgi:hypothetical protein
LTTRNTSPSTRAPDLIAAIDSERQHGNRSSTKRIAQHDFDLVRPGLGRNDRQRVLRHL